MIKPRDINFINVATEYAKKHRLTNAYTMAAILVEKREILSFGLNDYRKTNPHTPQIKPYIIPTHAEVNCVSKYISKRKYINNNMTLYVVGLTKTKTTDPNYVISSLPCESCMEFIKYCGIKRIVYAVNKETSFNDISIRELYITE